MSATELTRTRIKFCGFTRGEDVDRAVALGVDALGFVMWPKSSRSVRVEQLAALSARVPAFVTRVGLFVDQPAEFIEQCLPYLDMLQFHGNETPDECQRFALPWMKALRMRDEIDLGHEAQRYHQAQALLLDAYRPGTPGGTGETFDWSRIPANLAKPVILAGGLSADNIADAVRQVAPYAVDVSGGIEVSHGCKDADKMASFVRYVALADAR
ncbi:MULTISPECIES: phosphoribosylanthranilate isomerase [unclassified Halomonas]|uniref:phosphoribosylanthranilate isomerase n=1 Tax=unclassified Halomonas TaxID=2609666 RepID=UPI0007D90598|nr:MULTISPECIES: phosphoribosylanthranilate isomerase [unclassified Halomonas]MBT2788656.1 phosphoribosylanthranilate isomerase [Halomonas sp. ISL-106]MBT2798247.1 phosphoribosylanthranilate isomerase [Halomonas sp. ISL-104]OAL60794.1 N-(5'-phosphoribosyl)anthranilate isomerase [Halomonas sp. ALS9]